MGLFAELRERRRLPLAMSPGEYVVRIGSVRRVDLPDARGSRFPGHVVDVDLRVMEAGKGSLGVAGGDYAWRLPMGSIGALYRGRAVHVLRGFLGAAWTSWARSAGASRRPEYAEDPFSDEQPLRGTYLDVAIVDSDDFYDRACWDAPDDLARILFDNVSTDAGREWLRSVLPAEMGEHVRPGNELVLWDWCCERGIVGDYR